MPRLPKDPALRQNRSKQTTRAELPAPEQAITTAPKLPPHPNGEKWHPMARQFWSDLWHSPMASQYLEADVHGLFRMVILTDRFYRTPTTELSGELRQLSMSYGLSPIDRRRLQWTIAKTEEAVEQVERKRSRGGRIVDNDPRGAVSE